MRGNIVLLIIALAIFAGCSNNQQTPVDEPVTTEENVDQVQKLTVANFDEMATDLVGKEIEIKGLVNHTCKHGGKRMFIVDEGTDASVKIEAGENVSGFDAELEGSEVLVKGIIAEMVIDEAYLNEWEQEVMNDAGEDLKIHDGDHMAEGEETEAEENLRKIENYRNMMKESGKDKLSFYSVECISYDVVPPATEEE
ncbi:MAG: hypothetical protein KDC05_08070 [Bacteroidales bacterium]|nr:hypothetical protein [Bacteroidales bacterium]